MPSMRSARTSTTTWTRGRWTWIFETIECPKHGSTFDLDTGNARTLPAIKPVDVFPVTVTDDDVLIEV